MGLDKKRSMYFYNSRDNLIPDDEEMTYNVGGEQDLETFVEEYV